VRYDPWINIASSADPIFGFTDQFAIRWRGQILITTPGLTTFSLTSDDGSRLYIDNSAAPLVDNGGLHPMLQQSGSIWLAAGYHDIRVEYLRT